MIIRIFVYIVSAVAGLVGGVWGDDHLREAPVLAPPVAIVVPPESGSASITSDGDVLFVLQPSKANAVSTTSADVKAPYVKKEIAVTLPRKQNTPKQDTAAKVLPVPTPPPAPEVSLPVTATNTVQTISAKLFSRSRTKSEVSVEGIIAATNDERKKTHAGTLTQNAALTKMAELKAADLFEKQYFAHDSPTGETILDLAEQAEYDYLLVGENLARGDFDTSEEIVTAWMDSPGHRQNMLKDEYTEIGVAVMRGRFEGKVVWMAVQEFGLPLSVCEEPSKAIRLSIERLESKLHSLETTLKKLKSELETDDTNNALIEEYNGTVTDFNETLERYKKSGESYNRDITAFNNCIEERMHH